jgi:hypothetical protein
MKILFINEQKLLLPYNICIRVHYMKYFKQVFKIQQRNYEKKHTLTGHNIQLLINPTKSIHTQIQYRLYYPCVLDNIYMCYAESSDGFKFKRIISNKYCKQYHNNNIIMGKNMSSYNLSVFNDHINNYYAIGTKQKLFRQENISNNNFNYKLDIFSSRKYNLYLYKSLDGVTWSVSGELPISNNFRYNTKHNNKLNLNYVNQIIYNKHIEKYILFTIMSFNLSNGKHLSKIFYSKSSNLKHWDTFNQISITNLDYTIDTNNIKTTNNCKLYNQLCKLSQKLDYTNIYSVNVFLYPNANIYIAFPNMSYYSNTKNLSIHTSYINMMLSYDGVNWYSIYKYNIHTFFKNTDNNFYKSIIGIVLSKNKKLFNIYIHESNFKKNKTKCLNSKSNYNPNSNTISVYTIRTDGFTSLYADKTCGSCVITYNQSVYQIILNYSCNSKLGYIRFILLNKDKQVLYLSEQYTGDEIYKHIPFNKQMDIAFIKVFLCDTHLYSIEL